MILDLYSVIPSTLRGRDCGDDGCPECECDHAQLVRVRADVSAKEQAGYFLAYLFLSTDPSAIGEHTSIFLSSLSKAHFSSRMDFSFFRAR